LIPLRLELSDLSAITTITVAVIIIIIMATTVLFNFSIVRLLLLFGLLFGLLFDCYW
jgi:hypothetical protein